MAFVVFVVPIVWFVVFLLRRCCCARPHLSRPVRSLRLFYAVFAVFVVAAAAGAACVWQSGKDLHSTLSVQLSGGASLLRTLLAQVKAVANGLVAVAAGLNGVTDTSALTSAVSSLNSSSTSIDKALNTYQPKIQDGLNRFQLACTLLGAAFGAFARFCLLSHVLTNATRSCGADSFLADGGPSMAPLAGLLRLRAVGAFRRQNHNSSTFRLNTLPQAYAVVFWVVCGISYAVYVGLMDSCSALAFVNANTTAAGLDGVLPCFNASFAPATLSKAYQPLYTTIISTNNLLRAGCNAGTPLLYNPAVFNASRGLYVAAAPYVDNNMTVQLSSFNATYNNVSCHNVPPANLTQYAGYASSANMLLGLLPNVTAVANCSLVLQELDNLQAACPAAHRGVKLLFGGLLLTMVAFTVLLVIAVLLTRRLDDHETSEVAVATVFPQSMLPRPPQKPPVVVVMQPPAGAPGEHSSYTRREPVAAVDAPHAGGGGGGGASAPPHDDMEQGGGAQWQGRDLSRGY